jgi:hypothetical protein
MPTYPTGAGLSIALTATTSAKSLSQWSRGVAPSDIDALAVLDNHVDGHSDGFQLWTYSIAQANEYGYDGPPARTLHVPGGYAGRGHGFTLLNTGHIIVCTSEVSSDPDNGGESWFLIPPGVSGSVSQAVCPKLRCDELFAGTIHETAGARHAFQFSDGSIILGTNGAWKQLTIPQLLNPGSVDYSTLPHWTYNGNGTVSGIGHFDVVPVPGTRKVVVGGHDRFWQIDLGLPPGVIDGNDVPGGDGLDWIALGNNIGRPVAEDWGGAIARDANGNYWKQQGSLERLAFWSSSVIASLPKLGNQAGANPAPTRTMTADLITSLDSNVQGMYLGLDIDTEGGLWNMTEVWAPEPEDRAMIMRFSPQANAVGGVQIPDKLLYLPAGERGLMFRLAPALRLQSR